MNNIDRGCRTLVEVCANLAPGEKALIISEARTEEIGRALGRAVRGTTDHLIERVIDAPTMHGQEPPVDVAAQMSASDVIFGLTKMSMAHSQARYRATRAGARYLSLPDYSEAVLTRPALFADFRSLTPRADRLAEILTTGRRLTLTTQAGTQLTCDLTGRTGNSAPGWCNGPSTLASPPDAESNIAPLEDRSTGVIVVDGSIPHPALGLLAAPLTLRVAGGRVTDIDGPQAEILAGLFDELGNPATRVVAEFGIGLNPLAQLCGSMLEDEGCLGTAHLGIGANATIGGANHAPFHLDLVLRHVTVAVDDRVIMQAGTFSKELDDERD